MEHTARADSASWWVNRVSKAELGDKFYDRMNPKGVLPAVKDPR
jgi:hypothetical protein